MKRSTAALHVKEGAHQGLVFRKVAVGDGSVDDRDALRNDSSASQVHMPDLAVAHHAAGKTYRFAGGF